MATTFQMPKVVRGARLTPAAPRKTLAENNNSLANIPEGHISRNSSLASLSDSDIIEFVDCEAKKENTSVLSKEVETICAGRKENTVARGVVGGRSGVGAGSSRRVAKLEKPRPLKTAARTENNNLDNNQNEVKSLDQPRENGQTKQLSPHSAKLTTEKLIQQTLRDLDISSSQDRTSQPQDMSARTRLLSQVSDDSGYGESSAFSRQGSMLESLEECQDDEEWLVADDLYTTAGADDREDRMYTGKALSTDEIYTTAAGAEDQEDVYSKGPLYRSETSPSTGSRLPSNHPTVQEYNKQTTVREPQVWAKWNDAVLDHLQKQQRNEPVHRESNAPNVIHVCEDECAEHSRVGKASRESDISGIHVCEDDCETEHQNGDIPTLKAVERNIPFLPPVNTDIPFLKPVDRDIPLCAARQDSACYPDDLDLIELELQSLRGELGDSTSNSDKSLEEQESPEKSVSWITELKKPAGQKPKSCVVVREPITPLTMLMDVFTIEKGMPGGVYSAKGRRRMFRSLASVRQEEESISPPKRLQYSAEELLNIGCASVCRVPPESWAYLVATIPLACLPKNLRYFDPHSYIDERSYVDQHIGYVRGVKVGEAGCGMGAEMDLYDRTAPSPEDPMKSGQDRAERLAFNARKNQWTADSKIAVRGNTTDTLASNDRKWKPDPKVAQETSDRSASNDRKWRPDPKVVQENFDRSAPNDRKWRPDPKIAQENSDRSAPNENKWRPDPKCVQDDLDRSAANDKTWKPDPNVAGNESTTDKPSSTARKSLWTPDPARMEAMKAQEGQVYTRTLRSVMQARSEESASNQSARGFQSFKNHSTSNNNSNQSTFQKGFLPEVDEVDLDTKCDVRVRNTNKLATGGLPSNGVVPSLNERSGGSETKYEMGMRNKLVAGGPSNGVAPSLNAMSGGSETSFKPMWMNESRRGSKDMGQWDENNNRDDDDLLNRNLPEKCPW